MSSTTNAEQLSPRRCLFETLPLELLEEITKHLTVQEKVKLASVNKEWQKWAKSNSRLWYILKYGNMRGVFSNHVTKRLYASSVVCPYVKLAKDHITHLSIEHKALYCFSLNNMRLNKCSKLKELHLASTKDLMLRPENDISLPNLQRLYLKGDFDIGTPVAFLRGCQQLEFAEFQLSRFRTGLKEFRGSISPCLKSLKFTYRGYDGMFIEFPENLIREAKALEELVIIGRHTAIAQSFDHIKTLRKLEINNCLNLRDLLVPSGLEELDITLENITQASTVSHLENLKVLRITYNSKGAITLPVGMRQVFGRIGFGLQEIMLRDLCWVSMRWWCRSTQFSAKVIRCLGRHEEYGGFRRKIRMIKRLGIEYHQIVGDQVLKTLPENFRELEELILMADCREITKETLHATVRDLPNLKELWTRVGGEGIPVDDIAVRWRRGEKWPWSRYATTVYT